MGAKVLIVDDDEVSGGLSCELLIEAGFEADLLITGRDAIDLIKEKHYDLIMLDIMMPGINGMTLLTRIKHDPDLKNTKVIMVSGKSFSVDKKLALQYGAELFIEKPYSVEHFVHQIQEVLRRPPQGPAGPRRAPAAETLSARDGLLQVGIWGCRSPGASLNSVYGRHTACVSLDLGEQLLIFDAGSGLAELGKQIDSEGRRKEAWLFMSHFHADHTEGLASFTPASRKDFKLHISGAADPDKPLEELVRLAFESGLAAIKSVQASLNSTSCGGPSTSFLGAPTVFMPITRHDFGVRR